MGTKVVHIPPGALQDRILEFAQQTDRSFEAATRRLLKRTVETMNAQRSPSPSDE